MAVARICRLARNKTLHAASKEAANLNGLAVFAVWPDDGVDQRISLRFTAEIDLTVLSLKIRIIDDRFIF